jgi:hypothetical protein
MSLHKTIEQRLMRDPVIRELFSSFAKMNNEREQKAAQADPQKHKLSRVLTKSGYLYWDGGKNGKGQTIRFCYSTHRNVAGYFLGWREIISKQTVKRDRWCARKTRAAVTEIARKRYNKFIGAEEE